MSDTFRKTYKQLHPKNSALITEMKEAFEKVEWFISLVKSREASIALTNLETSSMWATKAMVLADEAMNGLPIIPEPVDPN